MQFAENYAKKGIVRLKEIFTPGTLVVPKTHNQLQELESVHKVVITPVCYICILLDALVKVQSVQFCAPQGSILHWCEHYLFIPSTIITVRSYLYKISSSPSSVET